MTDLATYLPGLLAAWSIQLFAVFSPGPAVALLLGVAGEQGRGKALIMTSGIASAAALIAVSTVLGVTAIVSEVSHALTVIRLFGAAYLLWLAYKAFRNAARGATIQAARQPHRNAAETFGAGFLLQISNPKAIAFWLAIASVGSTIGAPVWVAAVFVAGAFAISLIGHGAYALLFSARPVRLAYDRARRWVELALGGFLSFAAFKLATSEH